MKKLVDCDIKKKLIDVMPIMVYADKENNVYFHNENF